MTKFNNVKLSLYQFWEKNPLIRPWMNSFLPQNRMFSDFIITSFGFLIAAAAIVAVNIYVSQSELLLVAAFALSCWYFPGGWWSRWSVAAIRFQNAKSKEVKSND